MAGVTPAGDSSHSQVMEKQVAHPLALRALGDLGRCPQTGKQWSRLLQEGRAIRRPGRWPQPDVT